MNREQIINAIAELPVKERMALVRDLQQAAATDADYFSSGRPDDNGAYKKIIEQDKQKAQQQTAEQTYAQTAAKAITPANMNKETQSIRGTNTFESQSKASGAASQPGTGAMTQQGATPTPPGHVQDANNSGSNSDEKKPGDNLKEANKEQDLPANAAPGANQPK